MVADPSGDFLVVRAYNWDITETILVNSVDPNSGSLYLVYSTESIADVRELAVDPSGRFLYAALGFVNNDFPTVRTYNVDAQSGALTFVADYSFGLQSISADSITTDPAGVYAYVSECPGPLDTLAIDPISGTLSLVSQTYTESLNCNDVPDLGVLGSGLFAYLNRSGAGITGFTLGQNNGNASDIPVSPFQGTGATTVLAVEGSGKFVYATESGNNDVQGYAIDQNTGVLTDLNTAPYPAGSSPFQIVTITQIKQPI